MISGARAWPLIFFAAGGPLLGVRHQLDVVGVALVGKPDERPGPEALNVALESLERDLGIEAFARLDLYDEVTDRQVPAEPHHYLGMVGVEEAMRGQGVGKFLIEKVLTQADDHAISTGVCLNTETQGNVPLYEHLGFRVILEADADGLLVDGVHPNELGFADIAGGIIDNVPHLRERIKDRK